MPSRSGGGVYSRDSPSFGGSMALTELDGLVGFVELVDSLVSVGLEGLDELDRLSLSFFIIHIFGCYNIALINKALHHKMHNAGSSKKPSNQPSVYSCKQYFIPLPSRHCSEISEELLVNT